MTRVFYVLIALAGLAAAIANRRFATASERSSAQHFGREIRPGSKEHRFMVIWSRTLAVLVGTTIFVLGILGALGIIWTD